MKDFSEIKEQIRLRAEEAADSEQLSAVMRRLHQISGVMKVDRPAG